MLKISVRRDFSERASVIIHTSHAAIRVKWLVFILIALTMRFEVSHLRCHLAPHFDCVKQVVRPSFLLYRWRDWGTRVNDLASRHRGDPHGTRELLCTGHQRSWASSPCHIIWVSFSKPRMEKDDIGVFVLFFFNLLSNVLTCRFIYLKMKTAQKTAHHLKGK